MKKNTTNKVLLLSTCSSNAQQALWCLRKAAYRTVAIGNISKNHEIKHSILCNKFYEIPEAHSFEAGSQEMLSYIKDVVGKEHIDIIVPSGFDSVRFLSLYKKELSAMTNVLAVPEIATIDQLGNKHTFALFCQDAGVPHPRTCLLENINQLSDGMVNLNFPIVTKPLNLAGSKGVNKFNDKNGLKMYLLSEQSDKSNALPLLLQEFMPGSDVGFNVFASNGRINAWAIQHFLEIPLKNKAPFKWLQFSGNKAVFDAGEAIMRKSNYTGPANIDMRIDLRDGSIKVLEVNPRFWATTMSSLCDGVNFIDVAIKSTFNPDYKVTPRCSNHLWGNFWKIPVLVITKRDIKMLRYLPRFSMVQIGYMLENFILNLLSCLRRRLRIGIL